MNEYKVEIDRIIKKDVGGEDRTEIWAKIQNMETNQVMNKRIWWEDENGLFHDETPNLPVDLRDLVDNAWIEKRREW